MKLNAKELRKTNPNDKNYNKVKRNPIYIVADNVIDTYNIGSLFRLADAVAAEKFFICGDSEYPPASRIHKAAVGTEAWVPWEKADTAREVVLKLQKAGVYIIAVEQDKNSIPYSLLPTKVKFPCAIVIGHETNGVSEQVLDIADCTVEIPMFGINISLNVWGSAAIIAYKAIEALIFKPYATKKK